MTTAPAEGGDPVRAVTLAYRSRELSGNRVVTYVDTLAKLYTQPQIDSMTPPPLAKEPSSWRDLPDIWMLSERFKLESNFIRADATMSRRHRS